MYTILSKVYVEVAERLLPHFGTSDYYSGSFEFEKDGVEYRMVLSAIVYRHNETLPEGRIDSVIDNIVPVWWEFHTKGEQGEMINDFDFGEFKSIFLEVAR